MQVIISASDHKNQEAILANLSELERKENYIDQENRARKKRRTDPAMIQTNVRLDSVHKLIAGRHPHAEPPLSTQEVYFDAVLPMLVWKAKKQQDRPVDSIMWARIWTPALVENYPPEWFYQKEASVKIEVFPPDDDFAESLAVTYNEVQAFRLRGIGAVDKPKDQRDAERREKKREKDRERQRENRHKNGSKPHAAIPLSTAQPWNDLGISQATYYRRGLHRSL